MKKITITIIALMATQCSLWAQSISTNSTLIECLTFIQESLPKKSYDRYSESYSIKDIGLSRDVKFSHGGIQQHYLGVDWANFSDLEIGEANDDVIPLIFRFDSEHLSLTQTTRKVVSGEWVSEKVRSREFARLNTVGVDLPLEHKSRIPDLQLAAKRLAQLAQQNANPELTSAGTKKLMESIPEQGKVWAANVEFSLSVLPWNFEFVSDEDEEFEEYQEKTLVFTKMDKENQPTAEKAWIKYDDLTSISVEGTEVVFTGKTYSKKKSSPSANVNESESFRLPAFGKKASGKQFEPDQVLRLLRYWVWTHGVDLESDGYQPGETKVLL